MAANSSSVFPYAACLMPNLPVESQHHIRDISNYVVRPLGMLLAVLSFVCNSLVCITVARTKSLQHPSLLMLCSLAITDLIYAPYSLFRDIKALAHEHLCPVVASAEHSMSAFCILTTLANLAVISRDRYLAIRKPWWYRNHVNKSRAFKMIGVAWVISALFVLLSILRRIFPAIAGILPRGYILSLVFYIICLFVIAFSYLGIFFMKNQSGESVQMAATLQREKRLANTVGLILLILFLTFLPALVAPLALHAAGVRIITPYRPFYTFLLLLNGILNPLLNFGRSKDMRRGLRELFKCSRVVQPSAASNTLALNESVSESVNIPLERVSHAI